MNLPPVLRQRYFDANGNPLAGGKLYTYQSGTTTPQATYTDSGGGTPNANPVVLDANGEAAVWLDPELSYKFVLKDSNDVTQWTVDGVIGLLTADAVSTSSIQDSAVTTAKIADDAVTADKLRDDASTDGNRAVTTNHIRDSAVTTAKLASGVLSADSTGRAKMADAFVTQAKVEIRATTTNGTDPGAGGVSKSSAVASWTNNTTTYTDITSTIITTLGNPVNLKIEGTGAGHSNVYSDGNGSGYAVFKWIRGTTDLVELASGSNSSAREREAPGGIAHTDTPAAGTYTYKLQGKINGATTTAAVENVRIVADEKK
jgi:hypothetical protein